MVLSVERPSSPQADSGRSLPRQVSPPAVVLDPAVARRPWRRKVIAVLLAGDTVALLTACWVSVLVRFGGGDVQQLTGLADGYLLVVGLVPWLLVLAACRCYEPRVLGNGREEFRRVTSAVLHYFVVVAVITYAFRLEVARGATAVLIPIAGLLTLLFRFVLRQLLHLGREAGRAVHRVLVVGEGPAAARLVERLRAEPASGLRVVAVCSPLDAPLPTTTDAADRADGAGETNRADGAGETDRADDGRPVVEHMLRAVIKAKADTVAVAPSPSMRPEVLRRLCWELEGSGIDLLVAPSLTDVAGPRVHIRPVAGLPLLSVAEPEFSGARRALKRVLDWCGALLILLLVSPLLVLTAIAVRLSSPGPIFFRQKRIGQNGVPFTMVKFRSMRVGSEHRVGELTTGNVHGENGVLFKMKGDPRVTRVGAWLRRYSIDELPQLFNVLNGTMSLVGPRPALPVEVERYEPDVHRRLLVRPGITGLWQVSGRASLSWNESVRLDLYYVENWSPFFDLEILWRTVFAVLRGVGAH